MVSSEQLAEEVGHQGLVFGLHGAQQHRGAVPHHPVALVLVGIRRNNQVPGGRHRGGLDHHAGVHPHEAAADDRQGVDVQLHDFREVRHQLGDPHQDLAQLFQVRRRDVAVALEHLGHPGLLDEPPGQQQVQGRQVHHDILEDLGEGPPAPKRISGPKSGSCLLPMSSSQSGCLSWAWTVTPRMRASGLWVRTSSMISWNAARTSDSFWRWKRTPPTSPCG